MSVLVQVSAESASSYYLYVCVCMICMSLLYTVISILGKKSGCLQHSIAIIIYMYIDTCILAIAIHTCLFLLLDRDQQCSGNISLSKRI